MVDFKELVKPALRAPLEGRVALAFFASVLLLTLVATPIAIVGWLLGGTGALVLALHLMKTRADGEEFDWPSPSDALEQVAMPLVRFLVANLVPLVFVFVLVEFQVIAPWRRQITHDHSLEVTLLLAPGFWLSIVLLAAWMPFATLGSLLAPSLGGAANPIEWVRIVNRYRRQAGFVLAVGGGGTLAAALFALATPRGPFVGFLTALLVAWVFFATAALLGEFVRLYASELGYGLADASEIELGDPNAPAMYEPPPEPAKAAPIEASTLAGRLAAALDARDARVAVRIYNASPDADSTLAPALLLRVGQAAASLEQYGPALAALTAAGRHGEPESSKALVIAARILDERMRDLDGAKRLYQQVLQRFPGTQAAEFAARQLADTRFLRSTRSG